MKPAPFEYVRPESLDQALALMAEHGDDCKALAGGQSLMPLLNMRLAQPGVLVDLDRIPELKGTVSEAGAIRISAMTRNAELERAGETPPLVADALPHVGHFQIRNRGTVGGSLAHMDPAAEWPALALVLDAVIRAVSVRGTRSIPIQEFIQGPLMTSLEPDELLLDVLIPTTALGHGFAEVARRPGDYALVGAACVRRQDGSAAVSVFATGTRPHRLPRLEAQLGGGVPERRELIRQAAQEIESAGDIHASGEYRREVGAALVGQVVSQAWSGTPSN